MAKLTRLEANLVHLGLIAYGLMKLKSKRGKYSHGQDPFRNLRASENLGITPVKGVLLRDADKSSRLASLMDANLINDYDADESLMDTLGDKLNYSGIAIGLLAESNPELLKNLMRLATTELLPLINEFLTEEF